MQANEIRGLVLDQIYTFQNGHLASAFSLVEILLALYRGTIIHDPQNPHWQDRDRVILSKGHGCSALYAVLADCGYFPKEYLLSEQNGNILGGHPDPQKVPGIEFGTGSLGHGLAVSAGMALAAYKNKQTHHVYCIMGDGELQEGSVWEAALFIGHHKLTNLTVIIDYNKHQSSGAVSDILNLEPLAQKWQSFGWLTYEADGHNVDELKNQLRQMRRIPQPQALIAHTKKGKGVSFFETDARWHTQVPNLDEMATAKKELGI